MNRWYDGAPWEPHVELPDEFLSLYTKIYHDVLPNALSEVENFVRFQFSSRHDYFRTGKAWLALQPDRVRLCGFIQPDLEVQGKKTGYFGYWETRDALDINQTLFKKLEEWMLSQGVDLLVGPVNFTTFNSYRLRDGAQADEDIFIAEPFSPPYYQQLIQNLGFHRIESYSTYFISPHAGLQGYFEDLRTKLSQGPLKSYKLLPLNQHIWRENLKEFYHLTLNIFHENPAFVPITYSDFQWYMGEIVARRICPYSSLLVRDDKDNLVAYLLSYPQYGSLLKLGQQGSFKTEDASFDKTFPLLPYKMQIGKTVGILPAHRGHGLQYYMTAHSAVEGLTKGGYQSIAMALMRDGNVSQRTKPPFPTTERHYSLYGKVLGTNDTKN